LREALHPRPGLRDDLAGEEVAVVAVVAEAGERAPERSRHGRSSSSSSSVSGSMAASIAASSFALSRPSRRESQTVRRERTFRRIRLPSSVRVRPVRRRSLSFGVFVTQPALTSLSTWRDMPAGVIRSRSASSLTPIPGAYLIATRSVTWPGEIPTARASRRSSRPTRRRTGRSRSASATVSVLLLVSGSVISLTRLTIRHRAAATLARQHPHRAGLDRLGADADRVLPGPLAREAD